MTFDPQFAASTIYPGCTSAYLSISIVPAKLPMPPGYTLVSLLEADPRNISSAPPTSHAIIALKFLTESNILGFIAYNKATQTVLVAYRGTEKWIDLLTDLNAPLVPNPSGGGLVHLGFLLLYDHVRTQTLDAIQQIEVKLGPVIRIIYIGHSMGGDLATLGAYDQSRHGGFGFKPELWTLAQAASGDLEWCHSVEDAVACWMRVSNHMDAIPELPTPPLYWQGGTNISLKFPGCWTILPPYLHAHHLPTYGEGLALLAKEAT